MKPKYKDVLHQSTAVIIKNRPEYVFINSWAEENKIIPLKMANIQYPIFICPDEKCLMWTEHDDRALYYMSFDEFLSKIGYKI